MHNAMVFDLKWPFFTGGFKDRFECTCWYPLCFKKWQAMLQNIENCHLYPKC